MTDCFQYEFIFPTRVFFGAGRMEQIGNIISEKNVTIITTPGFTRRGLTRRVLGLLDGKRVSVIDSIESNPTLEQLRKINNDVKSIKTSAIVAIGGGSALDSGKVVAKCVTAPDEWSLQKHFLEGQNIHSNTPLPLYTIPTTSGTGAEVTPFATVWDTNGNKKYSLTTMDMYPAVAIVDPLLTIGMPEELTISTGLDAISQALESIWNKSCNPITLSWAIKSLELSLPSLANAVKYPTDKELRCRMSQASMLAGMAISQTRTALAHSMSYPLTLHYGLPHGIACSFMLPALVDFNKKSDCPPLIAATKALGFKNIDQLRDEIVLLLGAINVKSHFYKYVDDFSKVFRHVSDMVTPGRSGNNVRHADGTDIYAILTETIDNFSYL